MWHLLFWAVMVVWTSTIYDPCNGEFIFTFIIFNLIRLPVIGASTYFVLYFLIPQFLIKRKRYGPFTALFLATLLVTIIADRLVIGTPFIIKLMKDTGLEYHFFNEVPIVRNAFLLVAMIGMASMIRFFKLYLIQEREQHQLQRLQLATELAFLKTQVNPHFLFNSLNNLYSMAIQKEYFDLAGGLENLSGIMRYLTYDSNAQKVALTKEIELLQQYIGMQQWRLDEDDDITVVFKTKGELQHLQIAPVLLLPIVENAFKHGVRPGRSSMVSIDLEVMADKLCFNVTNTLQEDHREAIDKPGIGLNNVQKRLTLLYPDQHHLTTGTQHGFFLSTLEITLR